MTFAQDEASVQASQPIELYTIATPATTYYVTSYPTSFVWNGQTFRAASIQRNNIVTPQLGKLKDVQVSIALNDAIAQDLLVGGVPNRDVLVTIQRYQTVSNTVAGLFVGYVTDLSASASSPNVQLTVTSRLAEFLSQVMLPIAQISRLCQHSLYDPGCTMSQSGVKQTVNGPGGAFQIATTVVSIPGPGIYNLASVAGLQGGGTTATPLPFGFITRLADGEKRSIVAQGNTTIQVDVPFRALNVSDAVLVNVGCDRTPQTCRDKFNNIPNHGGHPFLVPNNPQTPTGLGVIVSVSQP